MKKTGNPPLVSVIMPVFNGQKHLQPAVESILSQSLSNFEFIIIDDGSTDSTPELLKQYRDSRIRVMINESNRGVANSLNYGIEMSRGTFVARMDSDDIALRNRLSVQVRFLERNPEYSLCGAFAKRMGGEGGLMNYPLSHKACVAQMVFNAPFIHPLVCWRKSDFDDLKLRYQEHPPTAEDYDLWVKASEHLKFQNIPRVLLHYRVDPTIKISSYIQQQLEGAACLRRHLLRKWEAEISEQEFALHNQICEGKLKLGSNQLDSALAWLQKLILLNDEIPEFDQEALIHRCNIYLYNLLSMNLNWIDLRAVILGLERFRPLALSKEFKLKLYMKRRMRFR